MKFFLLLVFAALCAEGAEEGDSCILTNGEGGVCKNVNNCPTARDDYANKRPRSPICFWKGNTPIVCCREGSIASTSHRPVPTTTRSSPKDACAPIPATFTTQPTGQKAWDKCLEYQDKYVFPCEKGVILSSDYGRVNHCRHNVDTLIIAGTAAHRLEFPHMVLLGYKNEANVIDYQCGGSLISDKFVLTAGHCLIDKYHNNVSHAAVGILKRGEVSASNRYGIKRVFTHDNYQAHNKYHDIALLELDRVVPLDQTTVPACLHTGDPVDVSQASATGWGHTVYNAQKSYPDLLQKVTLTKFTTQECSDTYPKGFSREMSAGYDEESQTCYGDRTKSKDTCNGDSGGPLQVKNKKILCMYTVIGVTSFGQACGFTGVPAIYTRVAHYLPWIESIVWPN